MCRATIRFSSVGTTQTDTAEPGRDRRGPPAAGWGLPEGWTLVQDHPRRGLVVLPAAGGDKQEVLTWLLEAGMVLSVVRLTGQWQAEVHLPL